MGKPLPSPALWRLLLRANEVKRVKEEAHASA
jgi:hypothetical protein